jgi:hypothetical protein
MGIKGKQEDTRRGWLVSIERGGRLDFHTNGKQRREGGARRRTATKT